MGVTPMKLIKYYKNSRKHKGVVLIYVILIMMILFAFTGAILTLMVSNVRLTTNMKNNYKAQLAAETGIQQGIESLKNKIINDPANQNIYAEMESNQTDSGLTVSQLSYNLPANTVSGSNPAVSFNDTVDGTPGSAKLKKNGRYAIEITSTATVNGYTKTIDDYIDERNIENKYFSKLFQSDAGSNAIRPTGSTATDDSFKIQQQDSTKWPSIYTPNYTNATYNGHEGDSTNLEVGGAPAILVTGKYTTGDAPAPTDAINLNTVFDTFSNYIRTGNIMPTSEIDSATLATLLGSSPNSYYNQQTIQDNLNYAGVYKMIFVHGNATLTNYPHTLVNYVIYVDGTLTIDGNNLPSTNSSPAKTVNLLNCSIYANNLVDVSGTNIVMTGMGSSDTKNKVITSLFTDGTNLSSNQISQFTNTVSNGTLSLDNIGGENFTAAEKGDIDDQMNKNLSTYYNGLEFRILDSEEH
jgi:Tfp pilus assembly protein PilX